MGRHRAGEKGKEQSRAGKEEEQSKGRKGGEDSARTAREQGAKDRSVGCFVTDMYEIM